MPAAVKVSGIEVVPLADLGPLPLETPRRSGCARPCVCQRGRIGGEGGERSLRDLAEVVDRTLQRDRSGQDPVLRLAEERRAGPSPPIPPRTEAAPGASVTVSLPDHFPNDLSGMSPSVIENYFFFFFCKYY